MFNKMKKKIKKLNYIWIVLILTVLTSCAEPAGSSTVSETTALGERYLLEFEYEQALVEFNAAIEIDPVNVTTYLGAANHISELGKETKRLMLSGWVYFNCRIMKCF